MIQSYVHTIGDSTLDNIYWMLNDFGSNAKEASDTCVEGQLQSRLNNPRQGSDRDSYVVFSHAYDGFTTSSLIRGDTAGRVLSGVSPRRLSPKGSAYLEYKKIDPNAPSFYIHPLNKLKTGIIAYPKATHYVVLSVCGNDFREQLSNPINMLRSIPDVLARYNHILNEIQNLKDLNVKPIIMLQYRVDANNDHYHIYTILRVIGAASLALSAVSAAFLLTSLTAFAGTISFLTGSIFALLGIAGLAASHKILPLRVIQKVLTGQEVGMAALGALMERFYQPILQHAKEENIPILDLPNTLNPYKPLYLAGIEPGVEGGKLIAEGISHIVKNHDFNSPSKLYSKNDAQAQFTAAENPGYDGWRVSAALKA